MMNTISVPSITLTCLSLEWRCYIISQTREIDQLHDLKMWDSDSMHCISCALKSKVGKPSVVQANSKVTFHVPGLSTLQFWRQKITGPRKTILSGFADSLSFFLPLPSRAISHARGHLRVSRFARRTTEKRQTAHNLPLREVLLYLLPILPSLTRIQFKTLRLVCVISSFNFIKPLGSFHPAY